MIFELGNKRLIGDGKYWVAQSANVIGDVTLKNDSSVWFNAVIRGDIENITVGEVAMFKTIAFCILTKDSH